MTRNQAFDFAKAEIDTYKHNVKSVRLALPEKAPDNTFYCFFTKGDEAICRVYMYDRKTVAFVKIINFDELKRQNPSLVDSYLSNGVYLYRDQNMEHTFKRMGKKVIQMIFHPSIHSIRSLA